MKLKFLGLAMLLTMSRLFSQSFDVLNYNYNGTPINGVKIKTNLPFVNSSQMPTVRIEGYNYGTGSTIGINLVWYIYNGAFINYSASSFGSYSPRIFLLNENSKVVIFIDDRSYFQRFKVSVFAQGMGETSSWFGGWTAADEAIGGTNIVEVGYFNNFPGHVGIGTVNPHAPLEIQTNTSGVAMRLKSGSTGYWDFATEYNNTDADLEFRNGSGEKMRLDANGNLGIGTTVPLAKLHIVSGNNMFRFNNGGSSVTPNISLGTLNGQSAALAVGTIGGAFVYSGSFSLGSDSKTNIDGGGTSGGTSRLFIDGSGNVGIGTTTPGSYKLAVNGDAIFKKVQVKTSTPWPDYVFHPTYNLRSLSSLDKFINENRHLPDVPAADEVEKTGLDVGATQAVLLKKIEELTLYIIGQDKKINFLLQENKKQTRK